MPRELLLLRHADAAWNAPTDFERPLTTAGRGAAQRVGKWLRQQALTPTIVFSSPATRARETAELVVTALERAPSANLDHRIYNADVAHLLTVLADAPASPRVLVVGHNPGCADLAAFLTTGGERQPSADLHFAPAAICQLSLPDDWGDLARGCAELLQLA